MDRFQPALKAMVRTFIPLLEQGQKEYGGMELQLASVGLLIFMSGPTHFLAEDQRRLGERKSALDLGPYAPG